MRELCRQRSRYVKRLHRTFMLCLVACGWQGTNVVTAVRILDKDAADCPQFVPLLKETRQGFELGEVSADKARRETSAGDTAHLPWQACGRPGAFARRAILPQTWSEDGAGEWETVPAPPCSARGGMR